MEAHLCKHTSEQRTTILVDNFDAVVLLPIE